MKEMICTGAGLVGSFIAGLFGGWDAGLTTLVICMAIDYATGLLCAGVFHKSQKSANGEQGVFQGSRAQVRHPAAGAGGTSS